MITLLSHKNKKGTLLIKAKIHSNYLLIKVVRIFFDFTLFNNPSKNSE